MAKQLIINADDIGLTRAITDGITEAHEAGVVTSTSFMVNQPATTYAAERLASYPRLGVGIHLNVCDGAPVSPPEQVSTLVGPDGKFLPPAVIVSRLTRWQVSQRELEAEYRAQIRLAKSLVGELTHADSHHHMHLFFAAVGPCKRALEAEGINRIRSSRTRHWPRTGRIGGPHGGNLIRRTLVSTYMATLDSVVFRNFISPCSRVETHPDAAEGDVSSLLRAWRATFSSMDREGVFELVCHPAMPDPGSRDRDRMYEKRIRELRLLTSPEFRTLIGDCGIELISYSSMDKSNQAGHEGCTQLP